MGKENSKLRDVVVTDLRQKTEFTEQELNAWYKVFCKECPKLAKGKITIEEFHTIHGKYFPLGNVAMFAKFFFRIFALHRGIGFPEFICALSVALHGTLEQKLKVAVSMHGKGNPNGYIKREKMVEIAQAIYEMVGNVDDMPEDESTPERLVDKIFRQMERNTDEILSIPEFSGSHPEMFWFFIYH